MAYEPIEWGVVPVSPDDWIKYGGQVGEGDGEKALIEIITAYNERATVVGGDTDTIPETYDNVNFLFDAYGFLRSSQFNNLRTNDVAGKHGFGILLGRYYNESLEDIYNYRTFIEENIATIGGYVVPGGSYNWTKKPYRLRSTDYTQEEKDALGANDNVGGESSIGDFIYAEQFNELRLTINKLDKGVFVGDAIQGWVGNYKYYYEPNIGESIWYPHFGNEGLYEDARNAAITNITNNFNNGTEPIWSKEGNKRVGWAGGQSFQSGWQLGWSPYFYFWFQVNLMVYCFIVDFGAIPNSTVTGAGGLIAKYLKNRYGDPTMPAFTIKVYQQSTDQPDESGILVGTFSSSGVEHEVKKLICSLQTTGFPNSNVYLKFIPDLSLFEDKIADEFPTPEWVNIDNPHPETEVAHIYDDPVTQSQGYLISTPIDWASTKYPFFYMQFDVNSFKFKE